MRYKCDNCSYTADEKKFDFARHLSERIAPGGVYTDRQCPKDDCGALAYPVKDEPAPMPAKAAARKMRRALLLIGAQHPVWNGAKMPRYDELVNGWLKIAREGVGAKGHNDDAKADWCSRQFEKEGHK